MKKCRKIVALLLLCLLCLPTLPVMGAQTEDEETMERIAKARALGLEDWIDSNGYLMEKFYADMSDKELSEIGVDGLVRTLTEEEVDAYTMMLNMKIMLLSVTYYQKVSQVNPDTGRYLYTGIFEVDGTLAYCIQRSVATPAKGSPTGAWQAVTNDNLRKVLYYGYNGPAAKGYSYVETALAAGEANGDGDNSLGRKVLAAISVLPSPPSSFQVWKVTTNGGKTQDLAFYTIVANGNGRVQKTSGKDEITNGNDCYSLQGAVYGVYHNAACTSEAGRLTTQANGYTGTISLEPGTYYVKEITAPKGYELSSEVKAMTITSGGTATVVMTDTPQSITPDLIVQKIDDKTLLTTPQGGGSFEGARFSVKFYAGAYEKDVDPETLGAVPAREWVFASDKTGAIHFQTEYLVSGDILFTDASGRVILPLGTVTIKEIKAPEGYRMNPEVFVKTILSGSDSFETIHVSQSVLELTLYKYKEGSKETLSGAVFEYVGPEGEREVLTTDESGQLSLKGLREGTHKLLEVEAPAGYRTNQNRITFVVDENQNILVTSKADETYGAVNISLTEEGNLLIEMEDKIGHPLPKTGSSSALVLMALGMGLCIWSRRKKKIRKKKER